MMSLPLWTNPFVAALAWLIASPPLLSKRTPLAGNVMLADDSWCQWQFERHLPWLKELDHDPSTIDQWMSAHITSLLGKQVESLLGFWLKNSPFMELHAQQVQIREGENTIGEFDFLFTERESGEVIHMEAACKFYLSAENSSDWKTWIGPNGHDSLAAKMEKFNTQLALSHTQAGRFWMHAHGIPIPAPMLFLKGYFFHPLHLIGRGRHPSLCGRNYPAGWYIPIRELSRMEGSGGTWIRLPRSLWLAPVSIEKKTQPILTPTEICSEVEHHIRATGKAELIFQVEEVGNRWIETSRGFVVLDSWPQHG